MQKFRRLLFPIGAVLGLLICAYAAFFLGVKEDLPQPPGAEHYPLNITKQNTVVKEWPETAALQAADASVYTVREDPAKAAAYYRDVFVTRRGWTEITPPGQPKELGPDQQFTMLAFSRRNSRVYIALSPAKSIYATDTELNKALRSTNIRENDNIAVIVVGTTP